MQCGSAIDCINHAAWKILADQADVVIAGATPGNPVVHAYTVTVTVAVPANLTPDAADCTLGPEESGTGLSNDAALTGAAYPGTAVALEPVSAWQPPVKRGGKTVYSDEKFVASVRRQFAEKKRPVSGRQQDALAKLLFRYRGQSPAAEELIRELNLVAPEEELERAKNQASAGLAMGYENSYNLAMDMGRRETLGLPQRTERKSQALIASVTVEAVRDLAQQTLKGKPATCFAGKLK